MRNGHRKQTIRPMRWSLTSLRQLQQHDIRVFLHPFEHDAVSAGRDVEVAYDKVRGQVGQLPLGARLEIDEPEVLVLNVAFEHQ